MSLCPICYSDKLKKLQIDRKFITSDVKVAKFKPVICECKNCSHIFKDQDKKLLQIIKNIYNKYEIYKISNGKPEFINYINNVTKNHALINFICSQLNTKKNKEKRKWLDYGCGNGSLMDEVSSRHENIFIIKGYDQYTKSPRKDIAKDMGSIDDEKYDVITLVHVLEHVLEPVKLIETLLNMLNDDGIIVINIPNIYKNPYDLFVIDHLHHFSENSLNYLHKRINNIKLTFYYLIENQILLEIKKNNYKYIETNNIININNKIDYLINFINKKISRIDSLAEPYYIFGTSIASQFITHNTSGKIIKYIDENPNKLGKKFNKIEVIDLIKANKEKKLCFPLGKEYSINIYNRLNKEFKNII